jgi:hypothetical protein
LRYRLCAAEFAAILSLVAEKEAGWLPLGNAHDEQCLSVITLVFFSIQRIAKDS